MQQDSYELNLVVDNGVEDFFVDILDISEIIGDGRSIDIQNNNDVLVDGINILINDRLNDVGNYL
jgi:hypothetical protein